MGEVAELLEVSQLDFFVGDVAAVEAGGEVAVAGEDVVVEIVFGELGAKVGALGGTVVEGGDVGALGHEHDAVIAEGFGFGKKGVDGEEGLAPEAGVADGMEEERMAHELCCP